MDKRLKDQFDRLANGAFVRAVRTLDTRRRVQARKHVGLLLILRLLLRNALRLVLAQPRQGLAANNVTAWQHHWRIRLGR